VGLASLGNEISQMYARIMMNMPQRTVLLSATLPKINQIDKYVDLWTKKYLNQGFSSLDCQIFRGFNHFEGEAKIGNDTQVRNYEKVREIFFGFISIPLRLVNENLNVIVPHFYLKDLYGDQKAIDILVNDYHSDKNIIKFYTYDLI
jgi:hypothetical protein